MRVTFKKAFDIRRSLFKQLGEAMETKLNGDHIEYSWRRKEFVAVLVQQEAAATVVPDSRSISLRATPPIESTPDSK